MPEPMPETDKSLEQRVAELEKALPVKTQPKVNTDVSLVECNAIAARAQAEIKAEKKSAENVAKQAIESAFRTQAGKPLRVQKNLSPAAQHFAADLAKKAAKS